METLKNIIFLLKKYEEGVQKKTMAENRKK